MRSRNIQVRVRAIITEEKEVLLCQEKGRDYWFFPGGRIEWEEGAESALSREIKEELGLSIHDWQFIGALENLYFQDQQKIHEMNLVFYSEVKVLFTESRENHLRFKTIDIGHLPSEKVLPASLKSALLEWLKTKNTFWRSEIEKKK